ncbi:hypothetical protein QR680_013317 [Steinernema hermaphroditum]|uniref:Kinesin-like protein n=1 Tax=Steinernema hermaphroditum TaxID=289476 RepID=A0AA39M2B2_9BILA|nr:hypothetical protein QR680_013317 [Steinernema hermaphroditum]
MGLERFHLLLKDDYLRFRQNKRIDELADLLIKYSTDSFRKDKHLLRGSTTGRYRLQISHANHKSAEKKLQEGGRVEKQANGSFTVFSSATSSGRNVTFFELCSCLEQNYATYFASNYLTDERVKKWAAPYREGAVVNCNMGLERFHLLLKDDYLRFRQNKRIDELADLLIKYSTDSFRKDKHLLRGSTTGRYRLQISHANHKSAEKKLQEGGRVEKQANGSFTVFSSATSSGRNVTFFELCSCLEQETSSMGHLPCSSRHLNSLWASLKSKLAPEHYELVRDTFDEMQERVEKLSGEKAKAHIRIQELQHDNKIRRENEERLEEANKSIKNEVHNYKESLEVAQTELARAHERNEILKIKNTELDRTLAEAKGDLKLLSSELERLKNQIKQDALEASQEIHSLKAKLQSQKEFLMKLERQHDVLVCQMRSEFADLRRCHEVTVRQYHNEIVDLKGNIRVMVRVRNFIHHDRGDTVSSSTVKVPNQRTVQLDTGGRTVSYEFPQVFGLNSTQEDVFESVKDLTKSALDGFNVCVIAYGQTGSGKTFTMRGGTDDNAGIIPRTVRFLLDEQKRLNQIGWHYEFSVSFLEIYKDQVFDLLNVRRDSLIPRMAGSVQIPNLTEVNLFFDSDMEGLLKVADNARSTASTKCNEVSSRSHVIFKLMINGQNQKTGQHVKAELNLVDLAGSERVKESEASGERFTETTHINKSLSALQNVLRAQLLKQNHVPYRDCKLTSVLQESLGKGSSKTLMIVNVAPTQKHAAETRRSLEFAMQTSAVNTGTAKRN